MTDFGSRKVEVRKFFNIPKNYLNRRYDVEIRAYITRKLLGEVTQSTILDIGCGDGTLSLQYAMQENKLTFVDLSDKMLDAAKQNTPDGLVQGFRYLNLDFIDYIPDQAFDIILCIGVLAHVQSFNIAIKKLYSLLKPGGRCLIQFTDNNCRMGKIESLHYSLKKAVGGNIHPYSLLKLEYPDVLHFVQSAGFNIANQCRYSLLLPGMGRLPDKFLYRYQLRTLETDWLSRIGSEVILLLVKP